MCVYVSIYNNNNKLTHYSCMYAQRSGEERDATLCRGKSVSYAKWSIDYPGYDGFYR